MKGLLLKFPYFLITPNPCLAVTECCTSPLKYIFLFPPSPFSSYLSYFSHSPSLFLISYLHFFLSLHPPLHLSPPQPVLPLSLHHSTSIILSPKPWGSERYQGGNGRWFSAFSEHLKQSGALCFLGCAGVMPGRPRLRWDYSAVGLTCLCASSRQTLTAGGRGWQRHEVCVCVCVCVCMCCAQVAGALWAYSA